MLCSIKIGVTYTILPDELNRICHSHIKKIYDRLKMNKCWRYHIGMEIKCICIFFVETTWDFIIPVFIDIVFLSYKLHLSKNRNQNSDQYKITRMRTSYSRKVLQHNNFIFLELCVKYFWCGRRLKAFIALNSSMMSWFKPTFLQDCKIDFKEPLFCIKVACSCQ